MNVSYYGVKSMREFDYRKNYMELLTPEIVRLLSEIHEYKGEQNYLIGAQWDSLRHLKTIAKIQSAEASNRIEGICTSDERIKKIVLDKTMPQNRSEMEIAGYRDVLAMIQDNHDYIPPKPMMLLQLYYELYKFSGSAISDSEKLAASEAEALSLACTALDEAMNDPCIDNLIVIPMFILDFLCIHPFDDCNERMSRLLTLLLLYRSGYVVGKYISLERLIEQTKERYYDTLQESSTGWNEGINDYTPVVTYLLEVTVAAYREFSSQVQTLVTSGLSKPERIREVIKGTSGRITKTELLEKCPDIAQITIQRTLVDLQKNGEIIKIGGGRYTAYTWNWERDA